MNIGKFARFGLRALPRKLTIARTSNSILAATLLLLVLSPPEAHAGSASLTSDQTDTPIITPEASEDFISVKKSYTQPYLSQVKIFSAPKCKATLGAFLNPETTIKDGLRALIEGPAAPADLACLSDLTNDWRIKYTGEPDDLDGDGLAKRKEVLRTKRQENASMLACYNPHPADAPEHKLYRIQNNYRCDGRWIDLATFSSLEKEREKLGEATKKIDEKIREREEFINSMPSLIVTVPKVDTSSLEELKASMNCYYDPPPPDCKGGKISYEALEKLKAEYSKRQDLLLAAAAEAAEANSTLRQIFKSQDPPKSFDQARAWALFRAYRCTPPTGTELELPRRELCQNQGTPSAISREQAMANIRKEFPDGAKLARDEWKAGEPKRADLAAKRQEELKAEAGLEYDLRRLTARFAAYAKSHEPGQNLLDDFCRQNEVDQRRDKDYSLQNQIWAVDDEKHWDWMRETGISEGELSAIKDYTGNGYGELNGALWAAKRADKPEALKPKLKQMEEFLNRGLDRSPAFTEKPVRRFSELPAAVLERHQVGSIVTYDAFTSTSKRESWTWQGGAPHAFLIYGGRNGKDIDAISTSSGEGEVLFKNGTRFKVLSRKPRAGSENFDFVLAEVDEAGEVIAKIP